MKKMRLGWAKETTEGGGRLSSRRKVQQIPDVSTSSSAYFNSQSRALTYTLQPNRLSFSSIFFTILPFLWLYRVRSRNLLYFSQPLLCHSQYKYSDKCGGVRLSFQVYCISDEDEPCPFSQPLPAMFSEMFSTKNKTHVKFFDSLSLSVSI